MYERDELKVTDTSRVYTLDDDEQYEDSLQFLYPDMQSMISYRVNRKSRREITDLYHSMTLIDRALKKAQRVECNLTTLAQRSSEDQRQNEKIEHAISEWNAATELIKNKPFWDCCKELSWSSKIGEIEQLIESIKKYE